MKKLELKDIAGYLPYDLACVNEDGYIEKIHESNYGALLRYINSSESDIIDYVMKPILCPLSDLCRTITHNSKEIIPIVECAKICDNIGWHLNDDPLLPPSAVHGRKKVHEGSYRVYFMFKHGSFIAKVESGTQEPDSEISVKNQVHLFDFLHELKLDYRSLIDSGLAIDANTLENNPYK
jgi:hypothetical protein